MGRIKLLWVDPENMDVWSSVFPQLQSDHGFSITSIETRNAGRIIRSSRGKQVVVIHWGTEGSIPTLKSVLEQIKERDPQASIGLVSCSRHPMLEHLVDFYIVMVVNPPELATLIKRSLRLHK